jgi:hypothetical protein
MRKKVFWRVNEGPDLPKVASLTKIFIINYLGEGGFSLVPLSLRDPSSLPLFKEGTHEMKGGVSAGS